MPPQASRLPHSRPPSAGQQLSAAIGHQSGQKGLQGWQVAFERRLAARTSLLRRQGKGHPVPQERQAKWRPVLLPPEAVERLHVRGSSRSRRRVQSRSLEMTAAGDRRRAPRAVLGTSRLVLVVEFREERIPVNSLQ